MASSKIKEDGWPHPFWRAGGPGKPSLLTKQAAARRVAHNCLPLAIVGFTMPEGRNNIVLFLHDSIFTPQSSPLA
jgi:hypothetical protein